MVVMSFFLTQWCSILTALLTLYLIIPRCKPAIVDGLAKAAKLIEHPMGWRLLEKTFK